MSDAAAGSVDKSVQVKLVLLGMSLLHYPVPILESSLTSHPTRRGCRWQVVRGPSIRESLSQCAITWLDASFPPRQVSNEFQPNKEPTIGAAFLTQKCRLEDRVLRYEIWDTAGQERFHSLAVSLTVLV